MSHQWHEARLAPPTGPVRMVIDTDAANEIDDLFALAWALGRPHRLHVEAVYAAPFSFGHRRAELLAARRARDEGSTDPWDRILLDHHSAWLRSVEARGVDPATWTARPFEPPAAGIGRSMAAICAVFDALGTPATGRVFAGAADYLPDPAAPQRSDAVADLVRRASAAGEPLYVAALGCLTNVASALLLEPRIAERIVIVWTAGYPTRAPHPNFSFNLEQDLAAVRVVLGSGAPLVYLPGFHVGAQLRLSGAEVAAFVAGRGRLGALLADAFADNPLRELYDLPASMARRSWVIWDLLVIAWLLEPGWVPSTLAPTPGLDDLRRWTAPAPGAPPLREAFAVNRDAIFEDLFDLLAQQT